MPKTQAKDNTQVHDAAAKGKTSPGKTHGKPTKKKKEKTGMIVPDFLFKKRMSTDLGQFRSVYGRFVQFGETPVPPSEFIKQKIKSARSILDAAAGMLDDVILNRWTRFNMHTFTMRLATIETNMIILIKGGIVLPKQESVSLLSDAIHRLVRLVFFPATDMGVLSKMSLELAELVGRLEFRDDKGGGFFTLSLRASVKSTRENLRAKVASAKTSADLKVGQKRSTFTWRGDKRIDTAIGIVNHSEELWRGHGMFKTFGKTEEIQNSLDEARAVMWQLHLKMSQKDPESAAVLFDEVDAVVNQLALFELSSRQKNIVASRASKQSGGKTWTSRMEEMLINKSMRAAKYVAKIGLKIGVRMFVSDAFGEGDFLVDLAWCGMEAVNELGLLDFNGFDESAFATAIPVAVGQGYSVLMGDAKVKRAVVSHAADHVLADIVDSDGGGVVDAALDSLVEGTAKAIDAEMGEDSLESVVEFEEAVENAMDVVEAVTGEEAVNVETMEKEEPRKPEVEDNKDYAQPKSHKARHKGHKTKRKAGVAPSQASRAKAQSQPTRPAPKSQACTIS